MEPHSLGALSLCLLTLFVGTWARPRGLDGDTRLVVRLQHLLGVVEQLSQLGPYLDPKPLPAPQDVQSHCEHSAFSCFQMEQLKPAGRGTHEKTIQDFAKQLRRKLPGRHAWESSWRTCPSCHSYERKPPPEFLARLKVLLQQMLHEHLSRPAAPVYAAKD